MNKTTKIIVRKIAHEIMDHVIFLLTVAVVCGSVALLIQGLR